MTSLIATSLTVSFTHQPLFSDVSLHIGERDRIALVGPNGAGKTTLLRVLSGQLTPESGTVRVPEHLKLALHDQRPERTSQPLRAYVSPEYMVELERRLRAVELEMAEGGEAALDRYTHIRSEYDRGGGEAWTVRVDTVLRGLGFTDEQLEQPLTTLSGGELTRASLARALAGDPDILLLDEPTNHLDVQTIDWLQEYIEGMHGAVVIVSHDRWFIESTCTSVVEVAHGKARRFAGSFVEYRAQQAMEAVTHQRHLEHWQTEVARLQRFVDRFQAGTRSRQATSRANTLDKLRRDVPAYADLRNRNTIGFRMPAPPRSARVTLDVRGMHLGFEAEDGRAARTLLTPSDFLIESGEKVALLGPNGSGKSTLLHSLAAACIPDLKQPTGYRDGEIRVGYGVIPKLVAQHDSELRDHMSMLGNMNLSAPDLPKREAMSLLGLFGFTGSDGERLVAGLSGGERRRLMLAISLTGSANLLLLDEPTNHLDMESREALEAAISQFQGTVLLISHDRALIEGTATRTVILHDQTISTVLGGFTEARAILAGDETPPPAHAIQSNGAAKTKSAAREKSKEAQAKPQAAAATTGEGRREVRRKNSPSTQATSEQRSVVKRSGRERVRRPATIEREIEQLEQRMLELDKLMLDPEVYRSVDKSAAALDERGQVERDIELRFDELEKAAAHHGE